MKNLQLDDATARQVYPTAIPALKAILEKSFPPGFFLQKITDRVKTFQNAWEIVGLTANQKILIDYNGIDKDMLAAQAFLKLTIIAKALNEGWEPDWKNDGQYKYYPWFDLSSGSGLRYNDYVNRNSFSDVGSRLCFKSRELAEYAAKQFIDIYTDFFII